MENRNLIIGYDLGSSCARISWYNEKDGIAESVCVIGSEGAIPLPTALCHISGNMQGDTDKEYRTKDRTENRTKDRTENRTEAAAEADDDLYSGVWLYGQAAIGAAGSGRGTLITGFVDQYESEPEICVDGIRYEKKRLTGIFLRESLKILETYFEVYAIRHMTITLENVSKKIMQDILDEAGVFGVDREHIRIQSHVASYEYFALSQKKELWTHDVGLFDYNENGMNYYHLFINRKHQPVIVQAQMYPLKMYMSGEMLKNATPIDLDRKFLEVLGQIFSQKIISTVYLTGTGFKNMWMNQSLRRLCTGRKVFSEDNIYALGACCCGYQEVSGTQFKQFIAVNDDIVPASIYIKGSRMREVIRRELVSGGTGWYNVSHSEQFILDGTDTVIFRVRDFVTNTERMIPLTLEGLPDRPDKTVTIRVAISFENAKICTFTMTDEGFGGIFPPSGKVWKKRINVAEYECDRNFKEKGRLIFQKALPEKVPYYFNISDTKIYSLEELCYYVYHNIYAVTKETFGEDLFYWLEKTALEPGLSKGFKNLKKTGASFKALVQHLMNYTDYYSHEECAKLSVLLDEIERQNPLEIRKIQADNLVGYCRYMDAVSAYMTVISQMDKADAGDITDKFRGSVYHNLGCTYMRLMNFKSAAVSFKRAFDLNKDGTSLKCYLWALKMDDDESGFFDAAGEYSLSEKLIGEVLREYEATAGSVSMGQQPDDAETLRVLKRLKNVYRS